MMVRPLVEYSGPLQWPALWLSFGRCRLLLAICQ
jgi:hypothetical protein